jgi:shikimate kinase
MRNQERHIASAVTHIVVVGLMGSGKTTVGRELAARLGWPLRDSDPEIEAATGRTVRALRDELGVDAMHELEARQLLDALAAPGPAVVAPAASVIDVAACRAALRGPGVAVVFLTATPSTAAARFVSGDHRPWYGTDPATFLAEQAADRYPRFRSVDPVELATDDRDPTAIADAALAAIAGRGLVLAPASSSKGDEP